MPKATWRRWSWEARSGRRAGYYRPDLDSFRCALTWELRQKEIPEAHAHTVQVPEQALLRPPSLASANSLGLPYHGAGE
jgi:hypothetical protein